jgi:hypothetical protein
MSEHNSKNLLSHLTLLKDDGQDTIELGYLIGTKNIDYISIEPLIDSLNIIGSVNVNFKFDGNKTLTLSTTENSIQFVFKLEF